MPLKFGRSGLLPTAVVAAALSCAGPQEPSASSPGAADLAGLCWRRLEDPPRTVVERPCGVQLAVLTDGARTVLLTGLERRFGEASAAGPVVTRDWVRVLPAASAGPIDAPVARWLTRAASDQGPDLLDLATQYLEGAPAVFDNGVQIAGDADYGPLSEAGVRLEGADFNDYLGVPFTYPDGSVDQPSSTELHSLDCSGYMRMLWGRRMGLPLARGLATRGEGLSRRAVQMQSAPFGVLIIPESAEAGASLGRLQAGDLVFFDADVDDGPAIDHVGMFLGPDELGHSRFVSSRKGANGPTLGDVRGASILDGPGLYARSFRSARRL